MPDTWDKSVSRRDQAPFPPDLTLGRALESNEMEFGFFVFLFSHAFVAGEECVLVFQCFKIWPMSDLGKLVCLNRNVPGRRGPEDSSLSLQKNCWCREDF